MKRDETELEQASVAGPALFQLDYAPGETFFPQQNTHGTVYYGRFVTSFTFPADATGAVEATYTVGERGVYLLNGATLNNFLPRLGIVLAVPFNGHWLIVNQVYVP